MLAREIAFSQTTQISVLTELPSTQISSSTSKSIYLTPKAELTPVAAPATSVASPSHDVVATTEEAEFLAARPLDRWKLIARTRTTDFMFALISLFAAFGSLVFSLKDVMPHVRAALATSAFAARERASVIDMAAPVSVDTAFVALFAMMLVWSVAAMTFSKTPRVYKAATDTNKTLLGVLLGYFGGKAR